MICMLVREYIDISIYKLRVAITQWHRANAGSEGEQSVTAKYRVKMYTHL